MAPIKIYSHLFKKDVLYLEDIEERIIPSIPTFYSSEVTIIKNKNVIQLQKDILLVKETLGGEVIQ